MVAADARYFGFCQFEFGCALGPEDGRYLLHAAGDHLPERVCVLRTGPPVARRSPFVRRFRRARGRTEVKIQVARATIAHPPGFSSADEASQWLKSLRSSANLAEETVRQDAAALNRLVRAHRIASGDAYVREIASEQASAVRLGYATGDQIADGSFTTAYDFSLSARRKRRTERIAPQEHVAALIAGRATPLACEELSLRARVDLEAGALKEATLQARLALETALSELAEQLSADALRSLKAHEHALSEAVGELLSGGRRQESEQQVAEALQALRRALAPIRSRRQ